MSQTRRNFLKSSLLAAGAVLATEQSAWSTEERHYKISLAQWSLHNAFFGRKGDKIDALDFAKVAKEKCGIDAIEYVNQFFPDKAGDPKYLAEMNKRAADRGVRQLLIMIDREGNLGDPDPKARKQAANNHHKWVEAAAALGCHSIRVNARSRGSYEEQSKLATDGLARLTEYAAARKIHVIVENHGGLSSNGKWLAQVIVAVDSPFCGTLPDFGNFKVSNTETYDKYQGVRELMPFAKAVSAKSYDFDAEGNETQIDYLRMMKIVTDAGYHGYVGIEYEGRRLSEIDGILATKRLLEKVHKELAAS